MMRYAILLLVAALPLMNGCAPLVVGGAAATGYVLGEDRRTVAVMGDDQAIENKTSSQIAETLKGNIHVNVTSYNKAVLLTGEVPDAASRDQAENIAKKVQTVRVVYNELAVGAITPMSSRANDGVITSKVKGRFVDVGKFNPLHVKVVTENGVVYLMGIVKKQEANDATEVARTTTGVRKVVRIFDYLD